MQEYKFWFSKRFVVCMLAFFREMNIFTLKANLNIAILDMTSKKEIVIDNATKIIQNPEFDWNSNTIGFVLGVNEYGSLLAPLGGYLAMRYGGSTVITISNLVISILTMVTPMIIRFNFHLFIVVRIIEGVTQTFRFVSFPELWSQWSPIKDRSKLMAITLTGLHAGPAITYPIFGLIAHKYSWPAIFYFSGGFSLLWTALWFPFVPNNPASDRWISKEELSYIQQDPKQSRPKKVSSMWKNIILSKHVYALGIVKLSYCFGTTITVICLPMYIQDLTGSKLDKIGVYAAIPNVINIFSTPFIGYIIDGLNNKNVLNTTQVYKSFICIALGLGGTLLLIMAHLPHNFFLLIFCLTLLKSSLTVIQVVCTLNAIALAPKCSSVLSSFLTLFHMLGSVIGPLVIAFIVTDHSPSQWNTSFITLAMISFVAIIFFLIFGSGEPQPWSYSVDEQIEKSSKSDEDQEPSTPS